MPQETVSQYSFSLFSFSLVIVAVLVIFCIVYLYTRKKRRPPQIDQKAGDEGED